MIILLILAKFSIEDIKTKQVNIVYIGALGLLGTTFVTVHNLLSRNTPPAEILSELLISLIPGLILLAASKINSGIGEGDAYIFLSLGAILGVEYTLQIMYLSFILAGIYSAYLRFIKRVNGNTGFAFVPFILFGYVLCIILKMYAKKGL